MQNLSDISYDILTGCEIMLTTSRHWSIAGHDLDL